MSEFCPLVQEDNVLNTTIESTTSDVRFPFFSQEGFKYGVCPSLKYNINSLGNVIICYLILETMCIRLAKNANPHMYMWVNVHNGLTFSGSVRL